MQTQSLLGRSILVVEDEPLIAMDIALAFQHTGAEITSTNTLRHALLLVEHDGLSVAILDHALPDGASTALYLRLRQRGIPFMIYSGFSMVKGVGDDVPFLEKPADHAAILAIVEKLIRDADTRRESGSDEAR